MIPTPDEEQRLNTDRGDHWLGTDIVSVYAYAKNLYESVARLKAHRDHVVSALEKAEREKSKRYELLVDVARAVDALGEALDAIPGRVRAALDAERARADKVEVARDVNNPAAQALNDLWRDVILVRNPTYGDWEYPGQAYRHLLAEFWEVVARASKAEVELAFEKATVAEQCIQIHNLRAALEGEGR